MGEKVGEPIPVNYFYRLSATGDVLWALALPAEADATTAFTRVATNDREVLVIGTRFDRLVGAPRPRLLRPRLRRDPRRPCRGYTAGSAWATNAAGSSFCWTAEPRTTLCPPVWQPAGPRRDAPPVPSIPRPFARRTAPPAPPRVP